MKLSYYLNWLWWLLLLLYKHTMFKAMWYAQTQELDLCLYLDSKKVILVSGVGRYPPYVGKVINNLKIMALVKLTFMKSTKSQNIRFWDTIYYTRAATCRCIICQITINWVSTVQRSSDSRTGWDKQPALSSTDSCQRATVPTRDADHSHAKEQV